MRHDTEKTLRTVPAGSFPAPALLLLAAVALVALPATPALAQSAGATPDTNAVGIADARPLAERAAASYRAQARYPDHARAVEPGAADPVRARRTPNAHSLRVAGEELPAITVWTSEVSYEHPAVVTLYAALDAAPGQAADPDAAVRGEVVTADGATVGTVDYRDDGEGADRRAGDGIHTASFEVPDAFVPELAASFGVRVTAVADDGATVAVSDGFLYAVPHAHLTGRYRDTVRGGSLVVEAEVKVEKAGRFHLEATLAPVEGGAKSPSGAEPVGWAQTAAELEPGTHWLALDFYGLMFHERGAAGPFRLASVGLSTTGAMPNALNDLVEDAHRTAAYPLARFTDRAFGNPGLLRAAERLEASRGRGAGKPDVTP